VPILPRCYIGDIYGLHHFAILAPTRQWVSPILDNPYRHTLPPDRASNIRFDLRRKGKVMPPLNGLSTDKTIAGVTGNNTAEPQGGFGVFGRADGPFGTGVVGSSSSSHGVHGINGQGNPANAPAISAGVWGETDNGFGVYGNSAANNGVHGDSTNSDAVVGVAHSGGKAGVLGVSDNGNGVSGVSQNGTGVFGSGGQRAGFFQGNVEVTGDVRLTGGDCAEDFDIGAADLAVPGTIMILGDGGILEPSEIAYDKRVVGVISGAGNYRPGIVLDKQGSQPNRKPIALVGKVCCKVDAQYGAVETGDLLTTSPTPGHAMKASDQLKAFGAVIGKALRPMTAGQGLIPIVVALQ
jgi:hypothetical protein